MVEMDLGTLIFEIDWVIWAFLRTLALITWMIQVESKDLLLELFFFEILYFFLLSLSKAKLDELSSFSKE